MGVFGMKKPAGYAGYVSASRRVDDGAIILWMALPAESLLDY